MPYNYMVLEKQSLKIFQHFLSFWFGILLNYINLNFNLHINIWPHSTYNEMNYFGNRHFFKALKRELTKAA